CITTRIARSRTSGTSLSSAAIARTPSSIVSFASRGARRADPFEPLLAIRRWQRAITSDGEDAGGDPNAVGDRCREQRPRGRWLARGPGDTDQPVDDVRGVDDAEVHIGARRVAADAGPDHPDTVVLDDEAEPHGAGHA